MMGNILTYIWDKFSTLFGFFGFGSVDTDQDVLTYVKSTDEVDIDQRRARVSHTVSGESHEKNVSQVRV